MASASFLFLSGDAAEEAGDYVTAREAFERGAVLGDASCWQRLGSLFDQGLGIAVDKAEAIRCYKRAWRLEDVASGINIAMVYRELGKRRAMIRWLRKAAEAGDSSGYLEMARCYRNGVGVRKSPEQAVRCLASALACATSEDERAEALELMREYRLRAV